MKLFKRIFFLSLATIVASVFISFFTVSGMKKTSFVDMHSVFFDTTTSTNANYRDIQRFIESSNHSAANVIRGTNYIYYDPDPIIAGETMSLLRYLPSDATKYDITWSSYNTNVAQVDSKGNVTGISPGNTSIIASFFYDVTQEWQHVFRIKVQSRDPSTLRFNILSKDMDLLEGETKSLDLNISPEEYSQYVEWTSSDTSIVTVDNFGAVTAVGQGSAEIKASCGNKSDVCIVTVKSKLTASTPNAKVETVTLLANKKGSLKGNETKRFSFELPFDANLRYVNHGNESFIVRVYSYNVAIVDSVVPVSQKDYSMTVAVEKISSGHTYSGHTYSGHTYELALKNPSDKQATYNFSLLWDLPVTPNTIWFNDTNITMPINTHVSIRTTATIDNLYYLITSSDHLFMTKPSKVSFSQHKKGENNQVVDSFLSSSNEVGSTDLILFDYYYSRESEKYFVTDVAVLHVVVKKPLRTFTCVPFTEAVIGSNETETYKMVLSVDGGIQVDYSGKTNIAILDSNYKTVAEVNRYYDGSEYSHRIYFNHLTAGTYYLKVTGQPASSGDYTIKAEEYVLSSIPTSSILLNKTTAQMKKGKRLILNATCVPSYATDVLTWSSSNEDIATVKDGVVQAKSCGTVTITAKKGPVTAICKITVKEAPVKTLRLNKSSMNIVGAQCTVKLIASFKPKDTTEKVQWYTSNSAIADGYYWGKNDQYCKVDIHRKGTVTITAVMGNCYAECKIKTQYDGSYSVNWGGKLNLGKLNKASNAKWSVEDTSILTVSKKGVVKAKAGGSTKVYRQENGDTYQYLITVKTRTIHVNHKNMHIFVCDQAKFNSEKLKVKNAGDDLTFKSSNTAVAVVNANGKVIAKSPGTATITAYSGGGSDTCKVTVNKLVYGTVKGKVTTLSGYRGGYEPEYAAKIYAYDLFDETRSYRFVQNNEPTYSIKLPVGAYRLEFYSGNCRDEEKVYVRGNQTVSCNARLN